MFLKYNIFTIAWAFAIFITCALPGKELPDLSYWDLLSVDKAAHAFVFLILVFLLIVGLLKQHSYQKLRYSAKSISLIIAISYGGLLEILQGLIFERHASFLDFVANTAGCLFGLIAFNMIYTSKLV